MPVYVYRCSACKEELEVKQGYHDNKLTFCIFCETENALQRIIQPPAGVIYKGYGWASKQKRRLSPAYATGDGDTMPPVISEPGKPPVPIKQETYKDIARELRSKHEGTKSYPLKERS